MCVGTMRVSRSEASSHQDFDLRSAAELLDQGCRWLGRSIRPGLGHHAAHQRSEPESAGEPNGDRCGLEREVSPGNESRLPDRNEELATRPVLPAIAAEKAEALADVIVLGLNRELHVGREIDQAVQRGDVDVNLSAGHAYELSIVADIHLKIFARPEA